MSESSSKNFSEIIEIIITPFTYYVNGFFRKILNFLFIIIKQIHFKAKIYNFLTPFYQLALPLVYKLSKNINF